MRYRRKYRSRFTRRFRRPFRRSVGRRRSFTKRVKHVLYRTAETKQTATTLNGFLPTTPIAYFSFARGISQGPQDNGRIGNTIFARGFSCKLEFQSPANRAGDIRIWIVWPRQLSYDDAVTAISSINFPMYGLVDQDNWIVWLDKVIHLSNPADYGRPNYYRLDWYKSFPVKLEFDSNTATQAKKPLFLLFIVHTPE